MKSNSIRKTAALQFDSRHIEIIINTWVPVTSSATCLELCGCEIRARVASSSCTPCTRLVVVSSCPSSWGVWLYSHVLQKGTRTARGLSHDSLIETSRICGGDTRRVWAVQVQLNKKCSFFFIRIIKYSFESFLIRFAVSPWKEPPPPPPIMVYL